MLVGLEHMIEVLYKTVAFECICLKMNFMTLRLLFHFKVNTIPIKQIYPSF